MNNLEATIQAILLNDRTLDWLGISLLDLKPGHCTLEMAVRPNMCNGLDICHGGVVFALADTCCAFSVNIYGRKSLSIETSINQFKSAYPDEVLFCTSKEESLGKKIGIYTAEIFKQTQERIALFKGLYYRTDKRWVDEA